MAAMVNLDEWGLRPGPFEDHAWPDRLKARVTTVGSEPRIHGYDVQADLARHYSFTEVALLALTGEPPEAHIGRAFDTCLLFLSPAPVAEAPANAAVMAHMVAARPNCVLAVGTLTLSEQAKFVLQQHTGLLEWLTRGGELPEPFRARSDDERAAVGRLRAALPPEVVVPLLGADPSLTAALLGTLHACGLTQVHQLQAAWILARMCTVAAEAFSAKRAAYRDYPLRLPEYIYTEARSRG
jgi:hypothetical protein